MIRICEALMIVDVATQEKGSIIVECAAIELAISEQVSSNEDD